jgi:molecular chaperone DnaK (HSP70)
MNGWAIDLGTTHSKVAFWNEAEGAPRLLPFPGIALPADEHAPAEAEALVPSAVHLPPHRGFWDRVGAWSWVDRRYFLGRQALIGRPALEANAATVHPGFCPSFKIALAGAPLKPLAQRGRHPVSARGVARVFARELLAEVRRRTGERVREAAFTVPVEAYEAYRAELLTLAKSLGIHRARFVDEPVAAALGYGMGLLKDVLALVLDFGGGTFHLALVHLSPAGTHEGACRVLAKTGRLAGGWMADEWLLRDLAEREGWRLEEASEKNFWQRQLLLEAKRVKEALYLHERVLFRVPPPPSARRGAPGSGPAPPEVTRERFAELLRERGLYRMIGECLEEIEAAVPPGGAVDEVLMVGGSTLLPGVYPLMEARYGRDRVRAWQPFGAVALGASVFSAGKAEAGDFIIHDYAFVTYDPKTGAPEHTVVVPRGTRFPTPPDLWTGRLVPTCARGEAERVFKLEICEIGRGKEGERQFAWDAAGRLQALEGSGDRVVVPLNASDPALGRLDPPPPPGDRKARLEIAFGVNADRWLTATVRDLKNGRFLMDGRPVVRLL